LAPALSAGTVANFEISKRLRNAQHVAGDGSATNRTIALDDAGLVMNAVVHGNDTDTALSSKIAIPKNRREAAIRLLTAIGYLKISNQRYSAGVPVLTESDKQVVDETLQLSRKIMTRNCVPPFQASAIVQVLAAIQRLETWLHWASRTIDKRFAPEPLMAWG
jgi:hypothetical protein